MDRQLFALLFWLKGLFPVWSHLNLGVRRVIPCLTLWSGLRNLTTASSTEVLVYCSTGVPKYRSTGGCILMLKETAERCQRAVLHQSCSNPPSHDNTTLIYMAPKLYQLCREGKLEEVRAALKRGSNVNSRGSLHTVCDDTQNLNETESETCFGNQI